MNEMYNLSDFTHGHKLVSSSYIGEKSHFVCDRHKTAQGEGCINLWPSLYKNMHSQSCGLKNDTDRCINQDEELL